MVDSQSSAFNNLTSSHTTVTHLQTLSSQHLYVYALVALSSSV